MMMLLLLWMADTRLLGMVGVSVRCRAAAFDGESLALGRFCLSEAATNTVVAFQNGLEFIIAAGFARYAFRLREIWGGKMYVNAEIAHNKIQMRLSWLPGELVVLTFESSQLELGAVVNFELFSKTGFLPTISRKGMRTCCNDAAATMRDALPRPRDSGCARCR
jgi:hypothetical protein